MFHDESEIEHIVDPDNFKKLAKYFYKESGREWKLEEMMNIHNHIEETLFRLSLFEMALKGIIIIGWDEEQNDIYYVGTKESMIRAESFKRKMDNLAIEKLINNSREDNDEDIL